MKRAAIGVRMHSGWGALVAVSNNDETGKIAAQTAFHIVDRRRVAVVAAGTPGAKQPYHFAANLELPEAEKFLASCFANSKRLAQAAVRDVVGELRGRDYRVVGFVILLASGRPLPPLASILASHPLLHTAEGIFFRDAFSRACEGLNLSVTGIRERDLDECVQKAFGKAAARISRQISNMGRSLGPPWTADQKTAALAALLVLAKKRT